MGVGLEELATPLADVEYTPGGERGLSGCGEEGAAWWASGAAVAPTRDLRRDGDEGEDAREELQEVLVHVDLAVREYAAHIFPDPPCTPEFSGIFIYWR